MLICNQQRQGRQNGVQLIVVRHLEDADVGVASNHPPKMDPLAVSLQVLRARLIVGLQSLEARRSECHRRHGCGPIFVQIGPRVRRLTGNDATAELQWRQGTVGRGLSR